MKLKKNNFWLGDLIDNLEAINANNINSLPVKVDGKTIVDIECDSTEVNIKTV